MKANTKQIRLLFFQLFISSSCLLCYAQDELPNPEPIHQTHKFGDFSLKAGPNSLINGRIGGGFNLNIFLTRKLSIGSDLVAGKDYFHFGPGSIVVPLCLLSSDNSEDNYIFHDIKKGIIVFLAFTFLSLEHTAIHLPIQNNIEIFPYISLCRIRYTYSKTGTFNRKMAEIQSCSAIGICLDKYIGRFNLSPFVEYNIGYKDHISGIMGGIYIGIYFPNNNKNQNL